MDQLQFVDVELILHVSVSNTLGKCSRKLRKLNFVIRGNLRTTGVGTSLGRPGRELGDNGREGSRVE